MEGMGHEVIVANPREIPGITRSGNKSDPEDAFKLALYGRVDARILHPIQHRSMETQQDLTVIGARAGLVEARTQLINMTRGLAKSLGHRVGSCGTAQFAGRVRKELPAEMLTSLGPVLEVVEKLSEQIRKMDEEIERLAREKYPEAGRLQQVWGVGPQTALCYVLTLEDAERYGKSRAVGAVLA